MRMNSKDISLRFHAFITSANTSLPNNMNDGQLPITELEDTNLLGKY